MAGPTASRGTSSIMYWSFATRRRARRAASEAAPARAQYSSRRDSGGKITIMRGHRLGGQRSGLRHGPQDFTQLTHGYDVHQRIIALGCQPQALEDVEPAQVGEQLAGVDSNSPGLPVQLDTLQQTIGKLHGPAMRPQRRVRASGQVMQNDEIANVFDFPYQFAIVGIDVRLSEVRGREVLEE